MLIDEYDSPILKSRGLFYDDAISFFRVFYGKVLKSNEYLKYGILSGVAQIAKESIFSGLNNLNINNVFTNDYEYFGFNEEDILFLVDKTNQNIDLDVLKLCYGNYNFGNNSIYNPWSVLNFLENNQEYSWYWLNTSENNLIEEAINYSNKDENVLNMIYKLVSSSSYRSFVNESVSFKDINSGIEELISLLIAAGYLSKSKKYEDGSFEIIIPNNEIKYVFKKEINQRYFKEIDNSYKFNLNDALKTGNINVIEDAINNYILKAFSYYDMNNEKNYQFLVLTICALTFNNN